MKLALYALLFAALWLGCGHVAAVGRWTKRGRRKV